jgi:hypothetical protein
MTSESRILLVDSPTDRPMFPGHPDLDLPGTPTPGFPVHLAPVLVSTVTNHHGPGP